MEEKFIIRKGKKYMTGHSYRTGFGYIFKWSTLKVKAIVFTHERYGSFESLASECKGKVEKFKFRT